MKQRDHQTTPNPSGRPETHHKFNKITEDLLNILSLRGNKLII
jgi:hypothetical protein